MKRPRSVRNHDRRQNRRRTDLKYPCGGLEKNFSGPLFFCLSSVEGDFFGTWSVVFCKHRGGRPKTLSVQMKEVLFMRKNFSQMTDEEKKQLFLEMAKKFGGVD